MSSPWPQHYAFGWCFLAAFLALSSLLAFYPTHTTTITMNSNNHNDFLPSVTTSQDSVKGAIHEIDENEERPECALPRTDDDDDEKKEKDDDDNDNDGKKKNKAKRNSSKMLNRFSTSGVALADKFTLLMNIAEDAVQGSAHFVLGKADKPRRYVFDRCDGKSDYRDHWKPPCAMFYVPMPVKWFPDLLEQNPIMEYVGKLGCVRPYDYLSRKIIFSVATLCQLVAFGMTFVAAMAISKDYDILQATSFTHGQAALFANDTSVRPGMIFDMGLLGVAVEQESRADGNTERVLRWDDFCDEFSEGFEKYWDYDACNECGQQSKTLVGSMLMSLLFSIPTFTTDILRFYPDYDVNCQKFFGCCVGFISMISSLVTWYGFNKSCINSFYSREIPVDDMLNPVEDDSLAIYTINFDWEAGRGYLFVVIATLLKIVDVVCNLAVPTPTICRDHGEQAIYEVIALNRDAEEGADEEEVVQSMRRLEKSFRVMKEQSMRNLSARSARSGGSTTSDAPSPWVRLRALEGGLDEVAEGDEEEEEKEKEESSPEHGAEESSEKKEEDQ